MNVRALSTLDWIVLAFALVGAIALYAIRTSASSTFVTVDGHSYFVEVAHTDAERERGLMDRKSLAAGHGMLFVFDATQPLAFWMKDTFIPLDIVFFDDHMQLVNAAINAKPCTTPVCEDYWSTTPARYALELPAGTVQRDGLHTGDAMRIGTRRHARSLLADPGMLLQQPQ